MKLDPKLQARLGTLFAAPTGAQELSGQLLLVPVEQLLTAAQPRQTFENSALQDLAASIRELQSAGKGIEGTGLLQPLLVRAGRDDGGAIVYTVTAGERRLRAAKLVGLERVPVVVSPSDEDDAWEHAIIENLLRADLAPLEEAAAIQKLMKTRGYSLRDAAKRLGKDKGYLENRLFLLKAPGDVQAMVAARSDTVRAAREIARVEDAQARRTLIAQALGGASFGEIQGRARQHQPKPRAKNPQLKQVSARADTGSTNSFKELLDGVVVGVKALKGVARALPDDSRTKARFAALLEKQAGELQKLAEQMKL